MILKHFIPLIVTSFLVLASHRSDTAIWQWYVDVETAISGETGAPPRAFLWVPPDCQRVRGVVVGQHNMEEEPILEHEGFRAALAELGLAEIWITPGLGRDFQAEEGLGQKFLGMMDALAEKSGYTELKQAPIAPIGHSAYAGYPWSFMAWMPERTLCALSVSGSWPFREDEEATRGGGNKVDGVPGLVTMGEYEWADENIPKALKPRAAYPKVPYSAVGEPGAGHFEVSEAKVAYLAAYLRKACQYRLPAEMPPLEQPVSLKSVDPTVSGWLLDRYRKDSPPQAEPAPVAEYQGNRAEAVWCFDEELARATYAFQERHRGKQVNLLGYVQDGEVVPQKNGTHQQVTLRFLPIEDGLTFKLDGTFIDTVPEGRPERWVGKKAGEPAEHSQSTTPVRIERICGPVRKLSEDTFAIRFYRMGMDNPRRSNEIWLAAMHPGDERFRPAVQQSVLRFPLVNKSGSDQSISFPDIADSRAADGTEIPLEATSSAGLRVHYYVLAGPAGVREDGKLVLTKAPPRARFPVEVTVVAWQWGRSIEPQIKTAEPVSRTFRLNK